METQTIDETKLEEQFKGDQNLRNEFRGNVKTFIAFSKANAAGRIQISRPKCCGPWTKEQFHAEVKVEGLNRKIAANEAELKRLSGLQRMQKESVAENEASQYANAEACVV